MHALAGVRVLEIAEMVAAPYAAKLLADLGADVIKIEPPGGDDARRRGPFPPHAPNDPEQSGLFLGLNTNKKSLELDLDTDAGKERLATLVEHCDIIIHSLRPTRASELGLDGERLLELRPSLVVCAITPFGHTGPQSEWSGDEITIVHGGGWGYLIPGDDPDPNAPPLTVAGYPASCQAGMAAAFATLGGLLKAQSTGIGEFIDMAAMAQVTGMLEASFIAWSYLGKIANRNDGHLLNPWGIFPCSDGLIFMVTVEQDQWLRLIEMMGDPEWAHLEVFATHTERSANQDLLSVYIAEWTQQHKVEELFHEGQRRRICFAPVFTMADLERQDHLIKRGFFHEATHAAAGPLTHMGAPYKMEPDPWRLTSAAPLLNEHPDASFAPREPTAHEAPSASAVSRRSLEGVRVVDFSWVWAGPFCTLHLAYLGAEIIKVESSSRPGLGRRLPIHPPEVEPTLNTCGYFNQWDQSKKSVELDLTDPEAIETVLRLVAAADVVVDNYATGVMERLGLSDETLRAANPDVIIASVTGFGHSGPLREYMGYGPTTAPLSGLTSMTGHIDGRPEEAGISFGDPAAGLTAAFAIAAALVSRRAGDDPARIDVSLWESTAVNAIDGWMGHVLGAAALQPMGSRTTSAAPRGVYRCAGDNSWLSIECASDEQWDALARVISLDVADDVRFRTIADRKANEDDLDALVAAFTADQEPWVLTRQLQVVGVAAYPSLTCAEVESNEQLVARGFWERFDHPEVGTRTHSGIPWRTLNSSNGVKHRAPLLGEHTTEVLATIQGVAAPSPAD